MNLLKPYDYWLRGDGGEGFSVNHDIPLGNSGLYVMFLRFNAESSFGDMSLFFYISLSLDTHCLIPSHPFCMPFSCSPRADWVLTVCPMLDDGLPIR